MADKKTLEYQIKVLADQAVASLSDMSAKLKGMAEKASDASEKIKKNSATFTDLESAAKQAASSIKLFGASSSELRAMQQKLKDGTLSLIAQGFKGIAIPGHRLQTPDGRISLTCPEMMEMFRLMEQKGVFLSITLEDGAVQVPEMEEVIQECPDLKIAVGHFGMVTVPGWMEQIRLARHKNVMIESGGITWLFNDEFYPFKGAVRAILQAADEVGMDKLMWGSDYPRTITAITYRMSYDFILKNPDFTEESKELFLGLNAVRFYGIDTEIDLPYIKNMSE